MLATLSRGLLLTGLVAAPLAADVDRIEGHSRADVVNGPPAATKGSQEDTSLLSIPLLPNTRIVSDIEKGLPMNARAW
jgi:hypothetical protein